MKMLDPLGEVLTKKEIKFLAEIFTDAWYQVDEDNLTDEGLEIFKSIEKKLRSN